VKNVQKSVVGCGRMSKNLCCRGRMSSDGRVVVLLAENKIGQELSKKSNPLLGSRDF
jgi:hypothetical protein